MKTLFNYLAIATFFLVCACCVEKPEPTGFAHNLLIYMAADNNLSSNAEDNLQELKSKYADIPDDHALLVFLDYSDTYSGRQEDAVLLRLSNKHHPNKEDLSYGFCVDTLKHYGTVNSGLTATVTQVIDDARVACPAQSYGLILWSHATGWLPKGLYSSQVVYETARGNLQLTAANNPWAPFAYNIYDPQYPQVKTFGKDDIDNTQMEIDDLATALSAYHHEYIIFDACLMGDIPTYYALRHTADYIVASPTEIIDTGFPYNTLATTLFPYNGESSVKAWAKDYFDKYDIRQGTSRSATIAVVKTSELENVAQAFKKVVDDGSPVSEVHRNDIQAYDRLSSHMFYDFEELAQAMGSGNDANAFSAALAKAIVYKAATDRFISFPITSYSGMATYIPYDSRPTVNAAFKATKWNLVVGLLK